MSVALFRAPTRFLVDGQPPDGFRDLFAAALDEHRFQAPLSSTFAGVTLGWCLVDDALAVDFSDINGWLFNSYAVFALRVEQKRIPGAILQPALRQAMAKWCRDNNRLRCPAAVKRELRDLVEADLLPKILPTRATYGVVWNLTDGWVTIASTSVTRCDSFRKLFRRTFGLMLTPADPLDAVPDDAGRLAAVGEIDLVAGTVGTASEPHDDDDARCPPHVASDFGLWLAWRAAEGRTLEDEHGTLTHWLDGRLDFRRRDEERACVSVDGALGPAALGALAGGAVVRRVAIVLRRADREYRVTLTGSDLARRGVRLPTMVKGGDVAEQLYEAAFLYEEMEALLARLFTQFARERLAWGTQGAEAIRRWLGVEVAQAFQFDADGQGWLFRGAAK